MNLTSLLSPFGPRASASEQATPPTHTGTNAETENEQSQLIEDGAETSTALAANAASAQTSVSNDQEIPYSPSGNAFQSSASQDRPSLQPLDTSSALGPTSLIPTSEIKTEDSPMPQVQPDHSLDNDTKQAILAASNEYGTRQRKPTASATAENVPPAPSPSESTPRPTGPPKKRAAPKSKKDANAPASRKRPSKKRRLDAEGNGSPASQRSATPHATPRKPPRNATSQRKSSIAADSNSDAHDDSDAESVNSEDQNLYCICRKKDNHTWMIACDGGCNDWYHGKCVDIDQQDEPLIDKYICPNCEEKGNAVSTWKPMCRREGCRGPARLKKGAESKYCSDECGRLFMRQLLERMPGGRKPHGRQGSKAQDSLSVDYDPLGGPIHVEQLKSMVVASNKIEHFKQLGETVLPTPPITPGDEHKLAAPEDDMTSAEQQRLQQITEEKERLRERRNLLKDREKLVVMVKEQQSRLEKGQCGFNPRLSLDDHAFFEWRHSESGASVFERNSLDSAPPAPLGDQMDVDRPAPVICQRKRCLKHGGWPKMYLQDVRFEEASLGERMLNIDREEKGLRERALIRKRDQDADGDENMVEVL